MKLAITFSSAAVNGAGSGGAAVPAFFRSSFSSRSASWSRKSAQVDLSTSLSDDRFALGDLSALSVDDHGHRLVERADRRRRQAFRARPERVAELTLLETGYAPTACRVIALGLGYGLPPSFPPHAVRTTPAARLPQRSSAPYRNHVELPIIYYDDSTNRPMSNGHPAVFGFPCRFPAGSSIRLENRLQGIDQK
jgi:hypothetical protein